MSQILDLVYFIAKFYDTDIATKQAECFAKA